MVIINILVKSISLIYNKIYNIIITLKVAKITKLFREPMVGENRQAR